MASLLFALFVLLLFAAAAWAIWRFGESHLPAERVRGIVAGAVAGCGLLIAIALAIGGFEAETLPEFVVTTETNQGAVSYPLLISHPGVEHELRIAPQREPGTEPEGLLKLRVILTGPGNATLINEAVTVASAEMDVQGADGTVRRGKDWIAWSQTFSPPVEGFYELALSLPPRSPRVQLRIGAVEAE